MKKRSLFLPLILTSIALVSCNSNSGNSGISVLAVFYLEGGSVTASSTNEYVSYRYVLEDENDTTFIGDPYVHATNSISTVDYYGHVLEGWYRTRTQNGVDENNNPIYTYTDKFDFSTDKMGIDGINLYAHWILDTVFSYSVVYTDESTQEEHTLGTYTVQEGGRFNDYRHYNEDREGYTAIGYYSDKALTQEWDTTYTHPGGDESLNIPVYVKYVEGEYEVVTTTNQLVIAGNNNIYLMADLDFGGEDFSIPNYTSSFVGNGHKISNFTVPFNRTARGRVNLGVFGTISNASISDVTFEDYTITINTESPLMNEIYVGPLAGSIENSTIDKVTINNASITITANTTVDTFATSEKLAYYIADSTITNETITNTTLTDSRASVNSLFKASLNEFNKRKFERRLK